MLAAEQYRAKAAEYTELLKAASLSAEGDEFRRLKRSYLVLAENEEWMADNRERLNIMGADENCYGDAILAPPDRVFDDTWATFRISADGVDNCPFPIGTKVKSLAAQLPHSRRNDRQGSRLRSLAARRIAVGLSSGARALLCAIRLSAGAVH